VEISLVDLKKQYAPLKEEILSGIEQVLDGMHLFLGENVQKLEVEFAEFCGSAYGIGVSDGTAALNIIMRALDIGPGDEVITVSHTFIATTEAIVLLGAKPVFVDVDPKTYLMDITQVEAKITPRTKAILPVHLYGQMVDMDALNDIASRHGLKVIEDACQAHGAEYKGRKAGSLGDAAGFSFYYSKNLGGYGEGGFITTNNADLAARMQKLRDHGSGLRYHHDLIGFNGRLDEIQAVVLRAKLPHLAQWNERRRSLANQYNELLKNTPVVLPSTYPGSVPVYHLYVIRTPRRDELQDWLKNQGVSTGIHYPIPVHLQASLEYLGYGKGDLPTTEGICAEILSLPLYAEMSDPEMKYIADAIKAFHDKN